MKRRITWIFIGFISLITLNASAQKGVFEAGLSIGYGFPTAEGTLITISGTTEEALFYSYGAGINAAATGTYFFSDNIGAGLDFNYLFGSPINSSQANANGNNGPVIDNFVNTGSLFSITPCLVLSLNHEKINPYGRFGIVLGSASIVQTTTQEGSNAFTGSDIETITGDLSVGFYGAFGLQFALSDKISLDAELFDRTLSFVPTQAVDTKTFDGQQKSPTITFVKNIDATTAPNTTLTNSLAFSSVGIKIGITVKLGGK